MIKGNLVRPGMWNKDSILDLYDDGHYSAIWGIREDDKNRSLGVRWNGNNEYPIGYPNAFGNPVWYSEPEFLQRCILKELLVKVNSLPNSIEKEMFLANLNIALNESQHLD